MEEQYNWNLILKVAIPFAAVGTYIFYTNIANAWKWFLMIIALILTGTIVYMKDKKKSNVFTACGLVFLIILIARFLKNFRII